MFIFDLIFLEETQSPHRLLFYDRQQGIFYLRFPYTGELWITGRCKWLVEPVVIQYQYFIKNQSPIEHILVSIQMK